MKNTTPQRLVMALGLFMTSSVSLAFPNAGLDIQPVEDMAVPEISGLQTISDVEMGDVQGEALFDISQQVDSNGTQFMRFLVNARIDTNLNIGELKLGDQDGNPLTDDPQVWLEKVSLSGGTGPDSYATLVRPFLEFAMKNYDQPENRELIGLRIGAESSEGILGVGEQDTSQNCLDNGGSACSDYGIREFHGYFEVADGQATVDIGEIKLAEYLFSRGAQQTFCNGTNESGDCVGDQYIPSIYTYQDFSTASEPNSFANHLETNEMWAGFCEGADAANCIEDGGSWVVRRANGTTGGAIQHRDEGDIDSTTDAVGCDRISGLVTSSCRSSDNPREYGVRPGQPDPDREDFFAFAASQATLNLESGTFVDQDGNTVVSGVLNGQSTTLNLIATGKYAPINFQTPDDISDDRALVESDNGQVNERYINEVYLDGELKSYFDTQGDLDGDGVLGEIFTSGEAGLEYAEVFGFINGAILFPSVDIVGRVAGIGIDTRIAEDIRFAHRLNISNTGGQGNGIFISFQSEDIHYPGTLPDNIARKGAWLGLETPVVLGDLGLLPQDVYLSDLEYRQIEVGVERGLLQQTYLNLLNTAFTTARIGDVNVNRDLLVTLADLPLGDTQAPPVNCYGGVDCF
ncbi:MAG: hypothetical protein SVC26_05540 [Pseudomonadota bacterium]|nr:hypothetical protein [Pseudomonadota bacterium]